MDVFLSKINDPLSHIKNFLSDSFHEIVVFSPYVKIEAIDKLDLPEKRKISIVTNMRLDDLLSGSSDIELYPYAKERDISVFINNNIHLKVFLADWNKMIFGSSNLTRNGLGYGTDRNYELNGKVDSINVDTIHYLRKIISESIVMDDDVYAYIKYKFDLNFQTNEIEEFDLSELEVHLEKDFLISSLPMTKDIHRLYQLIFNNFKSEDMEEVNCAIHDQLLYDLPNDLSFEEFIYVLKEHFFNSNFITRLLAYINEEDRYFGAVKAWVQQNCADVPVPSRRDLTGNIQVLYSWIAFLSDGQYEVDRPNHSERIRKVRN